LTASGDLIGQYDLASLELSDISALVFAPSADLTDSQATMHLFVAGKGLVQDQQPAPASVSPPNHLFLPLVNGQSSSNSPQNGGAENTAAPQHPFNRIVE